MNIHQRQVLKILCEKRNNNQMNSKDWRPKVWWEGYSPPIPPLDPPLEEDYSYFN